MAKTQIKNYVFKPGIGLNDNLFPDAYGLLESNIEFVKKEATQWIQDQIDSGTTGFAGYTYNNSKCERDIGFNIDAYLKDLRYGGNENTRNSIKYYWDQDVAQIDGDRQPEIQTYEFIATLITNFVLTNIAYTASNTEVNQTIDTEKTAEADAITKINTLIQNTADVIENGLGSLPALEVSGVGKIKIQGRYDLEDILLITNTTKNEIVYNFSNPTTGGTVEFKTDSVTEDSDFTKFLQTTDAITIITLKYDTSSHLPTDELQIFIEQVENGKSVVTTRPYDFGTDAIERMRVAQPLSMLDADFEYGLQPTKWAAIGTLRGYPSVFELPGTDTPVSTVVTDASAGTAGVGQSLVTVTTVAPHGFSAGTPVTIKALEDSVVGAARAEGSFVIVEVPSPTTFTYFAKSKVGNTNGDVLSTTFTQLRQAGFYTGANIGNPDITVLSQGSDGNLETQLAVLSGNDLLPYDGTAPEIGAPLTGVNVPTGTQVTGVISQSQGGGTYITPALVEDTASNTNIITVESSVGIVENLAVDRGDGFAAFISSINGNDIEFDRNFTQPLTANKKTYINVSGVNDFFEGSGALFNISYSQDSLRSYIIDDIANDGLGYEVGDRIVISGTDLGGTTPENDLTIIVNSVGSDNSIGTASVLEGTHTDGDVSLTGVTANYTDGNGVDALFDVTYEDGTYLTVDVTSPDESSGYVVGDKIVIPGSAINIQNGTDGINDLFISVDAVGTGGSIVSVSFAGQAPQYSTTFNNVPYTTSGSGQNAIFDVELNGGTYTTSIVDGGIDFVPTETITVLGTDLGGTSPENDLTITVDNVDGLGSITDVSSSGIAVNGDSLSALSGTNVIPTSATFNVTLLDGVYSVSAETPGENYNVNQQLTIPGTVFGGASPENDIIITVTAIDTLQSGVINTITFTGTGYVPDTSYTSVPGTNDTIDGTDATFIVNRDFTEYTVLLGDNSGSGYQVGDRIIISGVILDGITPLNDITIRVTNVVSGSINSFVVDYIEANSGSNLDLISTVQLSEITTDDISAGEVYSFASLATLEITFDTAHGLVPGGTFIVTVDSDNGTNNHDLVAGSFFATDVPTVNTLRYQARATGAIDTTTDSIRSIVYPRPDSFFIHRPFDGGVQLGTGGPQHGAQAIRQSKKYIRYQSGKGIMYTTGALFAPSYDLRSVTADGVEVNSLITIETDDNDHGVQEGGVVRLLGIETPGYNSGPKTAIPPEFDYEVVNVIDERTFQVRSKRRLGATTATLGFSAQMSVVSWHGATVRSGIFDDQNGIFWEFDGTQISVVQRTGTQQLAGTIALTVDNNLVTGTNTRFRDQLKAGDRIIIKGMTHVVSHVNSQSEITVTPDWRGVVNITGAKANLIVDKKVKQSNFNLDRLDGTGPSGYDIDIAKMQMIGIQYSWYGAGFIDFMLRGADGNFVYAHRMRNSNVNTEAFMRSGNLPVRYEVTNEGPPGKLKSTIDATQTSMTLEDTSFFPTSGTVYVDNEIIQFTGKDDATNTLTGLVRSATFNNFQAGATRNYTASAAEPHDARTGVILISQTITPLISHWGSAFITDGLFDEDRGYIFSYAETGIDITTTKQTAFLIRLSPSVSNALVGDLGERELLNRAQLLLQGLEITSDGTDGTDDILGGIVVEGILNPQNYPLNPNDIGWSGLSGVAQGGQPSFAQVAAGGSVVWSTDEAPIVETITAQSTITTTIDSGQFSSNGNDFVYVSATDYRNTFGSDDLAPVIGKVITGNRINNNTTITGGFIDSSSNFGYFFLSRRTQNGNISSNTVDAFTITSGSDLSDRNFGLFTKASVESAGATVGTSVTGGSVTFPANTLINDINLKSFAGTEYYEIQFNNSYVGTLVAGTGTVELTFIQPPYALPGETIFSFIATPGERSTLDLSELKELTNTPLGGRGTFPNGPDVLAINVYKVSGAGAPSNIILRWGEAQA